MGKVTVRSIAHPRLARGIWLFLVGGIASFLVFEIALRIIEITPAWRVLPLMQSYVFGPDDELGHATRKNLNGFWMNENRARVITNDLGLRDDPIEFEKAATGIRVMLMGDSYTEALQVEHDQTFESQAERAVSALLPARTFEIVNLGQSGASALQQLLRFERLGISLQPDLAIWMIDLGKFGDPTLRTDTSRPGYVRDSNGDLVIGHSYRQVMRSHRLKGTLVGRMFFWLMDHSRIFLMIHTRLRRGTDTAQQDTVMTAKSTAGCLRRHAEQIFRNQISVWRDGKPAIDHEYIKKFLSDVAAALDQASVKGIFAVSGIPNVPANCTELVSRRAELVSAVDEHLRQYGIGFHDVTGDAFNRAGDESSYERLFGFGSRRGIGHLNTSGHAVHADILKKLIIANLTL